MPSYFLPVLFSILSYLRGQRNFLLHKRLKRCAYCEKAIEERQDDSVKNRIFHTRDLCLRALDANSKCAKSVRRNGDFYETGRKGQAHCHYAEGRLGSKPGRRKKAPGR